MCAKEQEGSFFKVPQLFFHIIQRNSFRLCNHYDLNNAPVTLGLHFFLLFQPDIATVSLQHFA